MDPNVVADYMRTANTTQSQQWLRANWQEMLEWVDNAFELPGYDHENRQCNDGVISVEDYMTTHVFWIQLAGLLILDRDSTLHVCQRIFPMTDVENQKFNTYMKALILLNNRESIRLLFKYDALPVLIRQRLTKEAFEHNASNLRLAIQQNISTLIA